MVMIEEQSLGDLASLAFVGPKFIASFWSFCFLVVLFRLFGVFLVVKCPHFHCSLVK